MSAPFQRKIHYNKGTQGSRTTIMPDKIEEQISEIVGDEPRPEPTLLHYIVWGIFGLMGLVFAALLLYILFILLRSAFLFGIGSLLGTI